MKSLLQLQERILGLINPDAYFNADPDEARRIEVISQNLGDIENQIKNTILAKGISVIVVMPLLKNPNVQAIHLNGLNVPIVLQVTEDVEINKGLLGTHKPALDVCCEIVCLLHGAPTGLGDDRTHRIMGTANLITMVDEAPTYHCNFTAPLALTPRRAKAA